MALIKWAVAAKYADYAALEAKDTNTLYFVEETGQVFRGEKNYSEAVVLYNTDGAGSPARPTSGAVGKLYVDATTLAASAWDGAAYKDVVKPVDATVIESSANPVAGGAVKTYVDSAVAAAKSEIEGVTDKLVKSVAYDAADKQLDITLNDDTVTNVDLTNLAVSMSYASETGVLSLKDKAGTDLSTVNLPLEQFVVSGTYESDTKEIVLTLNNDTEVRIPAASLVDVYTGAATDNVTVSVSGTNVITATVKVDPEEGNLLTSSATGLKVAKDATKMDKLTGATAGAVVVVAADGAAVQASAVSVGGAALEGTPTANKLATEKAVADAIAAAVADVDLSGYVAKTDISAAIPETGGVDTKVASEKAVMDALTWKTVPAAGAGE